MQTNKEPLRVLDLFSGIGGFSVGLERAGMRTVAFCEIEPFCRRVLAKHWPGVPCFDDIRTLTAGKLPEAIDVICGGYPCQPFSVAGKRLGAADDRHLWPEYFRLVKALRPTWVIGENVAGHINMGLDAVLSDLEGAGYCVRTFVIPAIAVDAKHRRDRVWIVAHSRHAGIRERGQFADVGEGCGNAGGIFANGAQGSCQQEGKILADTDSTQCKGRGISSGVQSQDTNFSECSWWESEPELGRVAHGIPRRVDRLRGLGNAVVPQIPEIIGRAIIAATQ